MATTDLQKLKFNLQESQYPYFSDIDLELLLEQYSTVPAASYQGCLLKASVDSIEVSGVKIPSNRDYWLKLAEGYKEMISSTVNGTAGGGYSNSMRRSDE
jgi:hypothetical protein